MTGRELIFYILINGLEDEDVFNDTSVLPKALGLVTIEEAATILRTGVESVRAMAMMGLLTNVAINGREYILRRNI